MADVDLAILLEEIGAKDLDSAVSALAKLKTDSDNLHKVLTKLGATSVSEALSSIDTLKESAAAAPNGKEEINHDEPKAAEPKAEESAEEPKAEEPAEEPAAEEPRPEEPKHEEPKAEEPKAEEPKVEEPAEEPKAEEPAAEEPRPEEPKHEEPKAEEPKAEEPAAEEPKADEPKHEEPKAEEPAEEPKAEKPKAEEPKAEEPAEEPKPEEPKPEEPKHEEPKPAEPKVEEPKHEEPKVEEPAKPTEPAKKAGWPPKAEEPKAEEKPAEPPAGDKPKGKIADRWNQATKQTGNSGKPADKTQPANSSRSISDRMAQFGGSKTPEPAAASKAAPGPRERAGPTSCDAPSIIKGYNQVRDDNDPVNVAIFEQDEAGKIKLVKTREDGINGLKEEISPDRRFYAYVRVITGDDLSKRPKFIFILWVGQNNSLLKKARATTDKILVKELVKEMVLEIFATSAEEVDEAKLLSQVKKAGGADYGTGHRG